ncbi:MGH1-like glycoside hydrolase domain-containing protein [Deinococcus roseus]|uniref:Glucosidase n=1 Tax=Deinococcus roseus TaxID=392414 RepID=A0ABQ2DDT6_9DEIO|nr:glucosidase [Deinococcus roseus]GGJ54696.1 glucosidase [Deinococcus roseus]
MRLLPEQKRLIEDRERTKNWKRWGPYLSDRQWGTVREDYSEDGNVWTSFTHDQARSRAYRWGEDGLLGITDRECRLCFALALWNEHDPILKERLYGLTGPEGNHGEDVKELYYHLDSSPTHSYLKSLYKYPQQAFPYQRLLEENRKRTRQDPEFEILDTGIFDQGYFDVCAEYAKNTPDDLLVRISISNRGSERAAVHVLPTLWFRNTWSWGRTGEGYWAKPSLTLQDGHLLAKHPTLGEFHLHAQDAPLRWLFTDNETNFERLFSTPNPNPHTKDAFHEFLVQGNKEAVNPDQIGTRAAAHYRLELDPGETRVLHFRLHDTQETPAALFGEDFEKVFAQRIQETDLYYGQVLYGVPEAESKVARQAYAGLLHSKQFYWYVVQDWLQGDPTQPRPPLKHQMGRNAEWEHLYNRDIISMPDKWEYPWYAAWDLAFHMLPMAQIDGDYAREQIVLFLREWYMHLSGRLPAYEFNFNDVNPPVHAWAAWKVYQASGLPGNRDTVFLKRVFQKLTLNFTWWVNRKDKDGNNLFAGGFLGLDNIGVFDRSKPLQGWTVEQADGTAWMAFYATTMLNIALELAKDDPAYEDMASKYFEHFLVIADAINTLGGNGLWDEEDGFYYDILNIGDVTFPMKVRSLVGLLPLIAVVQLDQKTLEHLPGFSKRMNWLLQNRPDLGDHISNMTFSTQDLVTRRLLALPSKDRLGRVLGYLLDEKEFLSPYGIRSVSRYHEEHPYTLKIEDVEYTVKYAPGESDIPMFGGNSNWRGPIWFPINMLIIDALENYARFFEDDLQVDCPSNSGQRMNLREVAAELKRRLIRMFLPDEYGHRPIHGGQEKYASDPHFKDLLLFHEYFHGENAKGLGASHQTGWTALVASLIQPDEE